MSRRKNKNSISLTQILVGYTIMFYVSLLCQYIGNFGTDTFFQIMKCFGIVSSIPMSSIDILIYLFGISIFVVIIGTILIIRKIAIFIKSLF